MFSCGEQNAATLTSGWTNGSIDSMNIDAMVGTQTVAI